MIKIRYYEAKHEIKLKGHAEYAEAGKDIICASASMLCYTLLQSLNFASEKLEKLEGEVNPGDTLISCVPKEEFKKEIDIVYSTINSGFILLSANYPDYVDFKVI